MGHASESIPSSEASVAKDAMRCDREAYAIAQVYPSAMWGRPYSTARIGPLGAMNQSAHRHRASPKSDNTQQRYPSGARNNRLMQAPKT